MKRFSGTLVKALLSGAVTRAQTLELWQVRKRRFLFFFEREHYDLLAELSLVDEQTPPVLRYFGEVTRAGTATYYRILADDNATLIVGATAGTFPDGLMCNMAVGMQLHVTFTLGVSPA